MKPSFKKVKDNHYSSNELNTSYKSYEELYEELGYDENSWVHKNDQFKNTCATRLSLALVKAGVTFQGRLKIKGGAEKGKSFELGSKLLADQLARPEVLGKPEILKPEEAPQKILGRRGIVFFSKVQGFDGAGHIDLIETSNNSTVCNSACYFNSKEVWFWPLD